MSVNYLKMKFTN